MYERSLRFTLQSWDEWFLREPRQQNETINKNQNKPIS